MKKHNLFKILSMVILFLVVLTWIIPVANFDGTALTIDARKMVGFWEIFNFSNDSISYFGNYLLFVAMVGAFYGVLNKTGAYRNLLDCIAKKFKGKEHLFLAGLMVLLGIITSISGLAFELFIFVPLIISIILLMGYDKITALSVIVGSILVGLIGSTYGYYGAGVMNSIFALNFNSELLVKVFLFIIPMYLLITYTLKYAKGIKKSKAGDEEDPLLLAETVKKETSKKKDKKSTLPIVIALIFIAVVSIMGYISWDFAFKTTAFTNFHNWVMGLRIGNFHIFSELFNGSTAFGSWWITDITTILFFITIIIPVIYRTSLNDALDGAFEGIKKVLPVMGVILLINIIFLVMFNNQFNLTIQDWLITDKFNFITMSLNSIIQSTLFVYLPYAAAYTMPVVTKVITDTTVYGQIGVIFQAMFGLIMFIVPTSLILVAGLAYTGVSYKEWFRYILKLVLEIFLVVLAIITIMTLV